ncbi:MAG: hypothetical protein ABWX83_08600 [Luteibacter sp.]
MNTTRIEPGNGPAYRSEGAVVDTPIYKRISWGSIFAGAIIAVVIQLVLSLIGAGIGFSVADPMQHDTPDAASYGYGAAIWWGVSSVVALFAGGWVAGHLAGSPGRTDAMLHGLVTWGLAALVGAYLVASTIASVAKGGATAVGTTVAAAGSGIAAAAGPLTDEAKKQLQANGITMDSLKGQAQQLLAQTGKPALQPDAIKQQANSAANQMNNATQQGNGEDVQAVAQRIISSGTDTVQQADRQALVNVVMARTGVSQQEAEQRVDTWITQYQQAMAKIEQAKAQAEAKAREAADAAAKAAAKASLGSAIALILGAMAAALGGALAGRRYVVWADERATPAYRV